MRAAYKSLRQKYDEVKSQLAMSQANTFRPQTPAAFDDAVLGCDGGCRGRRDVRRRAEEYDKELADLIKRNTEMLAQIKQDL